MSKKPEVNPCHVTGVAGGAATSERSIATHRRSLEFRLATGS
jgi:hypothetical protein